MQVAKYKPVRSEAHLKFVRSHACCITQDGENCNGLPVVAHHLTIVGGRSMSKKPCDSDTLSLCFQHHSSLHFVGERTFWREWKIDPELIADDLASRSPSEAIRNTLRVKNEL